MKLAKPIAFLSIVLVSVLLGACGDDVTDEGGFRITNGTGNPITELYVSSSSYNAGPNYVEGSPLPDGGTIKVDGLDCNDGYLISAYTDIGDYYYVTDWAYTPCGGTSATTIQ